MSHAQVALTAQPSTTTPAAGQTVPMWGLVCGAATGPTCTSLNPSAGANWQPPLITVQTGNDLVVNLTNHLKVPTSLVIVGQLGGGLGASPTRAPSPAHAAQSVTWPIVGSSTGAQFTPPHQGDRVQSFGTEVAPGATTSLTWTGLRPGTYLLESGTHPSIQGPMGLYGVVVVTTTGTSPTPSQAYPGVAYDSDVPLLLSEIDAVQNTAVDQAVNTAGFLETTVWSGQPGGCGDPTSATYHTCYPPAVNYDPRYYLINGSSFDRTNAAAAAHAVPAVAVAGNVLLRFVNAGLRMHVPSVVGLDMALVAEDGNVLPGIPKVQNSVFLAAGKTYDVLVKPPATSGNYSAAAFPLFDRALGLSTNNQRDGGMQGYLQVAGGALPGLNATTAVARPDQYFLVHGNTLTISDPAKGVIANDTGVYGVAVLAGPTNGSLTLNTNGTFTYVPNLGTTSDSFTYQANGNPATTATVTLAACTASCLGGAPTANADSYTSTISSVLQIAPPGVLANDRDPSGLALTAAIVAGSVSGGTVTLNADGSFTAVPTSAPAAPASASVTFRYNAVNAQKTSSAAPATVTVTFKGGSNVAVKVLDAPTKFQITDYRWIIEEDRTFQIDPTCQVNSSTRPGGCPALPVPSLGTSFHTSYMPVVAAGCVGTVACESGQTVFDPVTNTHQQAVCDVGNGVCRTNAAQQTPVDPSHVALDPAKHYYLSILPGDAGNTFSAGAGAPVSLPNGKTRPFSIALDCPSGPSGANFAPGSGACGHGMGGAPIAPGQTAVNVLLQQTPLQTAKVSVFVFEDDSPLNGEVDVGRGTDAAGSSREPGLGGFEIKLFDDAGGTGDPTGQMSYDMFNMPLSNSLAGTIDPATGKDACPISKTTHDGLVGMIPTCPKFESDGTTFSPLAGQAIIANLMPGRYGVVATPAADRIARGEEWLQTNTLDGQKAHDAFIKVAGPAYFQEFGPAGYHVSIGFANPALINQVGAQICAGLASLTPPQPCSNKLTGRVTNLHYSRPPNQHLYGSGSRDSLGFTQCYVSVGDPDGDDIAFSKCDSNGTFSFPGLPDGTFRITIFDQWNDQIVDGLATAVQLGPNARTVDVGDIAVLQWHTNLYTRTFFDMNGDGVSQADEPGLTLLPTNIRFRDGSYSNFNNTDLNGYASFNEIFPLFNWYVVEADTTRFKQTGVHVVYDAGGPTDDPVLPGRGRSTIAAHYANTVESASAHLPPTQRVPGAVYCGNADCAGFSIKNGPGSSAASPSTGRIDPPSVTTLGWQGFSGQSSFIEFGKAPFAPNENGGIKGEVVYASTRPFDDPALLIHTKWTPNVPNVTVNLYQEGTGPDGTVSLTLVDTTRTSSWDDWAQGFRSDGVPNMNCPGQESSDPFFFTLQHSTQWLDPLHRALPADARFKCYDGMHAFNQLQPAPYDGMYKFPSVTSTDPATGKPTGTNCSATVCVDNPTGDGTKMLPAGKYVVEVVVPPGYELVKEEDKNILIGDNYIAPVTQQFVGLGNIFILPDQAAVNATYNRNNAQNPTTDLGTQPRGEGDTGSVETKWPCAGAMRIVPDYISLFPGSHEVAPFAGASRRLCDRKEVTLDDQMSVQAKFWVFSSTHVAAHFTGFMLDDFSSEFDPYSPQFGEKFAVPNVPISMKDFAGNEISRVYSDQWGIFNGLNYSTWEVNPPNPTGYAPTMMVACMNDPGPIPDPAHPGQTMNDPLFNPAYSKFCYEIPFMPGQTQYMDTPVVPVSAFADGYNPPDCAYPDATPAVRQVNGDRVGPWVSNASGAIATINVTAHGGGYNATPAVTIAAPPAGGVQATATAEMNSETGVNRNVVSINIVNAGSGYTSPPSVTIAAPLGAIGTRVQATASNAVLAAGAGTLIITALGDQPVPNHAYSGPGASTAPYNQKFVTRHYGFGNQCTSVSGACKAVSKVTIGGVTAPITAWNDSSITVKVPGGVPSCVPLQRARPAGTRAERCGELGITAGNGKQSIDTVTVTVGGKPPTVVAGENQSNNALQAAIDSATPGDLLIVAPGTYNEMLLMWKPLRLQGVGAASVTINANTHPSGKLDPWRRQVDCLFGLALSGGVIGGGHPYDPTGTYACPPAMQGKVDPIPLEPTFGWDLNFNGNLSELLIEPTLLGAYEGAAITVLAKGMSNPAAVSGGAAPILLNGSTDCAANPSDFLCNPSRIDGLSVTNSSQGGGGIFLHGWNHFTEVSNNRVFGNAGTLTGGITIGQVEVTEPILSANGLTQLPYGYNRNVSVHHNAVTSNASYGDELNSTTPSAAGGVTFCSGADNYDFNYNWVCGNMSSGDGGGVAHFGFSYNGDISHNWVLFNQSNNPTLPTYGGGIIAQGAAPDGTACENAPVDVDCAPALSDGVGPGLRIDGNLIIGNTAESGKGGGLRLQNVNGTDVQRNPGASAAWYAVNVINNIIVNNVSGWAGAGVSLQDAVRVNFVNNTVASNDATASAGVLFNTRLATQANVGPPNCTTSGTETTCSPITTSEYQPAGLETARHTPVFIAAFTNAGVACPPGTDTTPPTHACRTYSIPVVDNDLFWHNRSFFISVNGLDPTIPGVQNVVTLNPTLNQAGHQTGYCDPRAYYWDIGAFGDTGPSNHSSGVALTPRYSILTDAADYPTPAAHNSAANPNVASQYCNGSRVPPEGGGHGFAVPPGVADTVLPNPLFGLLPSATPDEGNQWINMLYGPLALANPTIASGSAGYGAALGSYVPTASSAAVINAVPSTSPTYEEAPRFDFFGTPRKGNGFVDIGAVEFVVASSIAVANVTPTSLAFATSIAPQTLTLHNAGGAPLNAIALAFSGPFARAAAPGTCTTTLAAASTCTINVVFRPTAAGAATGTLILTADAPIAGSPVHFSGTGLPPAATLAPATHNFATVARGANGPMQIFALTNTGNVPVTGITQGTLGGASPLDYAVNRLMSTCGPAGGGQLLGQTTLAAGGPPCIVTVQFKPRAAPATIGVKNATISLTDVVGTHASTLTGTANP